MSRLKTYTNQVIKLKFDNQYQSCTVWLARLWQAHIIVNNYEVM